MPNSARKIESAKVLETKTSAIDRKAAARARISAGRSIGSLGGLADPLDEDAGEAADQLRVVGQKVQEVVPVQADELGRLGSAHGGAARLPVERRHLAHTFAGAEAREDGAGPDDL